jgi:hypothetical protein
MAIDVFFTGLMLICLDGQPNCPVKGYQDYPNTAWVVIADGQGKPCGWNSNEITRLELRFLSLDFQYTESNTSYCKEQDNGFVRCLLPDGDLCVTPPAPALNQTIELSLRWVPRLDQVDRRFKGLRADRLSNPGYVPARINFAKGIIGSGPKWPLDVNPVRWYRSDGSVGGPLPRELSDRLKVTYAGDTLEIAPCDTQNPLIVLKANSSNAAVEFRNRAENPTPDYVAEYDDLAYLLWYYRLASWDTTFGTCPNYSFVDRDAVLLRCVRDSQYGCSSYPPLASDTRYWPAMLGNDF